MVVTRGVGCFHLLHLPKNIVGGVQADARNGLPVNYVGNVELPKRWSSPPLNSIFLCYLRITRVRRIRVASDSPLEGILTWLQGWWRENWTIIPLSYLTKCVDRLHGSSESI